MSVVCFHSAYIMLQFVVYILNTLLSEAGAAQGRVLWDFLSSVNL